MRPWSELLLGACCWCCLSLVSMPGEELRHPPPREIIVLVPREVREVRLDAIRGVESSRGTNCVDSDKGAKGCYQIMPRTAVGLGCVDDLPHWWGDGDQARACAARWLDVGKALCRRWDDAGAAHFYFWGECMWVNAPLGDYEKKVIAEMEVWRWRRVSVQSPSRIQS